MDLEKSKTDHTNSDDHRKDFVDITINGDSFKIHRGRRSVNEIKVVGGVPIADKLEQVIDNKLVPLEDNASVVIKGGEEFKSHVPSGGAA